MTSPHGPGVRRRRAPVLVAGAVLLVLLVGDGRPLELLWLPLVTGLVYLAAAAGLLTARGLWELPRAR